MENKEYSFPGVHTVPEKLVWNDPLAYREPQPTTRADLVRQIDKLRDYFRYEPRTGKLRYRHQEDPESDTEFRSLATVARKTGYATVNVYGMQLAASQVVWLLHYGRWPYGRLKRRDGDTLNDCIENLYEPRNEPFPEPRTGPRVRRNASRGVARCGPNHWQAYVRVRGRQIGLGKFKTEAEALLARAAYDLGVDDLV